MPAIRLSELKQRSAHLAEYVDQPEKFVSTLHRILDDYSERTHRSGQSGTPPPLIPTYNVPFPVLRQLQRIIFPHFNQDPEIGLNLVDALWEEPYLEFRLMAAQLLGQLPGQHSEQIIERVRLWSQEETDNRLLNSLLKDALAEVLKEPGDSLLDLVKSWLASDDTFNNQLGLRGINLLLENPDYEDIPFVLRLLTPYMRSSPSQLHPEIVNTIKILAGRTPKETAFFLRQTLEAPNSPQAAMLIRQSVNFFPPDLQAGLRSSLRETKIQQETQSNLE